VSLYDDAVTVLTRWHPRNDQQRRLRDAYIQHLAEHPDGLSRDCHPDHLTASALLVSVDRSRVLLNLHRRLSRWMQFGGHCEPQDLTLADAARREATEESGVEGLRLLGGDPVQLSVHEVPCGPVSPAHHLDVRFVAVVPDDAVPAASAESEEVRWFPRRSLPAGVDASVRELVEWSRWL
jgi:8-oxo-dGTP pyrophosphatase MutT (NUDIX family)